jgi:hypothetical protein
MATFTTFADLILKTAQLFPPIAKILEERDRNRINRIAAHLEAISYCLADMSSMFRNLEQPYNKCRELDVYVQNLSEILSQSRFESSQIEELVKVLSNARSNRGSALNLIGSHRRALITGIMLSDYSHRLGNLNAELSSYQDRIELERIVNKIRREAQVTYRGPLQNKELLTQEEMEQYYEEIRKIEEACGLFKGLAEVVRASSG